MTRPALALLPILLSACAHRTSQIVVGPPVPPPAERLAAADVLLREGCLDCLVEAYRAYDALRAVPTVAGAAAAGALRSAALIALRQRELGMVDDGYLDLAEQAAASGDPFGADAASLEMLPAMAPSPASADDPLPPDVSMGDRSRWRDLLSAHADDDAMLATLWLRYNCRYNWLRDERTPEVLVAPLVRFRDEPIVAYHVATCSTPDRAVLETLASAHPRFHEIEFLLALRATADRELDAAEAHLNDALAWHPDWPSALIRLGSILLTAEDFEGALELYERALTLAPGSAPAMLGRIQALSQLLHHEEAIARSTELLQTTSFPGDAYYWRAWNENHLGRLDEAWADVQESERLWRNANVFMLAGLVAYRRHQLDVAQDRFSRVLTIEPANCDAQFYLASVRTDLASWTEAASLFAESAGCYEIARDRLAAEIDELQQSAAPPDRVARQVARREAQRATALRLQRQSWFNGAVANLRLNRTDQARQLAERLVDDEQFGARARQMLADTAK